MENDAAKPTLPPLAEPINRNPLEITNAKVSGVEQPQIDATTPSASLASESSTLAETPTLDIQPQSVDTTLSQQTTVETPVPKTPDLELTPEILSPYDENDPDHPGDRKEGPGPYPLTNEHSVSRVAPVTEPLAEPVPTEQTTKSIEMKAEPVSEGILSDRLKKEAPVGDETDAAIFEAKRVLKERLVELTQAMENAQAELAAAEAKVVSLNEHKLRIQTASDALDNISKNDTQSNVTSLDDYRKNKELASNSQDANTQKVA